jgi:hypothetical protein
MELSPKTKELVEKLANSCSDNKFALEDIKEIKQRVLDEGEDKIHVKRAFMRAISTLKKRAERRFALDANHARALSTEVKRERKLDEASENFYSRTREIKSLETLFKIRF